MDHTAFSGMQIVSEEWNRNRPPFRLKTIEEEEWTGLFLQVFQRESDYECGALSGAHMTLSSEVPVSFHNRIIWK